MRFPARFLLLARSARDLRCFSARKLLWVDSAREMGYFLCSEVDTLPFRAGFALHFRSEVATV